MFKNLFKRKTKKEEVKIERISVQVKNEKMKNFGKREVK